MEENLKELNPGDLKHATMFQKKPQTGPSPKAIKERSMTTQQPSIVKT